MGSLIAQVDGRDVALNVGYHKCERSEHGIGPRPR
jgi:hypothetical protein